VKIASFHLFIMVPRIPFVKEDRLEWRQKMGILCPGITGFAVECTKRDIDFITGPSHFMLDMQEVGSTDRRDLPLFPKRAHVLHVYSISLLGDVCHEISRCIPAK
jgi:hypothetical protein